MNHLSGSPNQQQQPQRPGHHSPAAGGAECHQEPPERVGGGLLPGQEGLRGLEAGGGPPQQEVGGGP